MDICPRMAGLHLAGWVGESPIDILENRNLPAPCRSLDVFVPGADVDICTHDKRTNILFLRHRFSMCVHMYTYETLRMARSIKITTEHKDGHHYFDISDESVLAKVNFCAQITFYAGRSSANWYLENNMISPTVWKTMSRLINRAMKQCGDVPDEGCNCP